MTMGRLFAGFACLRFSLLLERELLTAAISGQSTLTIQGSAATGEDLSGLGGP